MYKSSGLTQFEVSFGGTYEWWEWLVATSLSFSSAGTVVATVTVRAQKKYVEEKSILTIDVTYWYTSTLVAFDYDFKDAQYYFSWQ